MIECMFVMCPAVSYERIKKGCAMTGEGTDDLMDWGSESETLKHSTQPNYKSLQACSFSVNMCPPHIYYIE